MREPYRTLFEGYESHWLLGRYLTGDLDEPDWHGIADDGQLDALSTGEKVLLDFAAAYANVGKHLDEMGQWRVAEGLRRALLA